MMSEELEIAIAFANGFGGERVLKLFVKFAPKALALLKKVIIRFSEADRVENIKITRDGVEIGRMRSGDIPAVKEFVCHTLDQLERMEVESGDTLDGFSALQPEVPPRLIPEVAPRLLEARAEESKDQAALKNKPDEN